MYTLFVHWYNTCAHISFTSHTFPSHTRTHTHTNRTNNHHTHRIIMGLISKIEEKLSGSSKSHTEEEKLRQQQALDTSRTKDTTTGTSSSSTGGLTGHGSHGTHPGQTTGTTSTTGIYNPLHNSGNSPTHGGSSGITGGTHPLVTGANTSQGVGQTHAPSSGLTGAGTTAGVPSGSHHTSGLSGQGSHFAGQDHGNTHHTGMGVGSGTQHSGAGVGSNAPHWHWKQYTRQWHYWRHGDWCARLRTRDTRSRHQPWPRCREDDR